MTMKQLYKPGGPDYLLKNGGIENTRNKNYWNAD